MEQSCGHMTVEMFPGNTEISAPIFSRELELSLAHAQRCIFLIMEQSCCPLTVEIVPGKHCDFSTYLAKRARAQIGACAELQFSDYGILLWSPGSRNGYRKAGKHCDFSTKLTKKARAQSDVCAEVQVPDYGTEL
jgi:hypothetical protein